MPENTSSWNHFNWPQHLRPIFFPTRIGVDIPLQWELELVVVNRRLDGFFTKAEGVPVVRYFPRFHSGSHLLLRPWLGSWHPKFQCSPFHPGWRQWPAWQMQIFPIFQFKIGGFWQVCNKSDNSKLVKLFSILEKLGQAYTVTSLHEWSSFHCLSQ